MFPREAVEAPALGRAAVKSSFHSRKDFLIRHVRPHLTGGQERAQGIASGSGWDQPLPGGELRLNLPAPRWECSSEWSRRGGDFPQFGSSLEGEKKSTTG